MLTRRLALRILGPTAILSLLVMGACTCGVLYLNSIHLNVARDLSENVQSTQAAGQLEVATEKLITLLRSPAPLPPHYVKHVERQNAETQVLLTKAAGLANLEGEQLLVPQIQGAFDNYVGEWNRRTSGPGAGQREDNEDLARLLEKTVLPPCRELRHFNTNQIEQSDRENRAIVQKLRWGLLLVGIGLPLGGLVLGYGVARGLHHSIYQLSVRIRDVAGRLNRDLGSVTLEEEGDFPDLHRQVQGITEEIGRVVEQLQQREREVLRAEQLAAVGQVAAGVAHELRNPLTSVKMLVQTGLEGDSAAGLGPEDLAVIEHEIRRMEQCIRLLLDFARPPESERRLTDLLDVVRRAVALMDGRARRQKVAIVPRFADDSVMVKIDPEQIHQILVNLLLNALDALPRGGTIEVAVTRRDLHAGPEPDWKTDGQHFIGRGPFVDIVLEDTGTGIPPRIRERLFEPFVSSKETGLGLGLSISRRLVEAHGGHIWGENRPEGGARFVVRLPTDREPSVSNGVTVTSEASVVRSSA